MKITGWKILSVFLGGGLGYLAGQPSPLLANSRSGVPVAVSAGPLSRPAAFWKSQLTAVREAPASRSETAWVKWAFAVPDAEIADAISSLNPRADLHALRLLFARWVQLDAAAAWKAFDDLPIPENNHTWYGGHDEDGLSMNSSSLHNTPRALIIGRMLHSWHRNDPAEALAYSKKIKSERDRKGYSDSGYGAYQISQFIMEKTSPATAGGILPDSAAEVAAAFSQPASDTKQKTLRTTLEKWAGQDSDAAARWLLALPEEERRSLKLGLSADAVFGKSSAALKAEILASGLRETGISQENISGFLKIPRGQEGRYANPNRYESYETNYQLRKSAETLNQWATKNPAAAQSWLAAQPEDALKFFLSGELAGTLSRTSPSAAIALLKDLPDDQLPVAVAGLTAGWMQKDAAACAAWVAKIDDAATRDACQQTMARSIMAADPALALRLSTQITDETARREIQKAITQGLSWNPIGLEKIIAGDPAVQASLESAAEMKQAN